jgi:hypothetical protein
VVDHFTFTYVIFSIIRFGKLSVHFPSLPISIRRHLAQAIYLSKERGTEQYCSNILLGLSNSQANWNDLEERACEGIVENMRMTASGFNNQVTTNWLMFFSFLILYSLGDCQFYVGSHYIII